MELLYLTHDHMNLWLTYTAFSTFKCVLQCLRLCCKYQCQQISSGSTNSRITGFSISNLIRWQKRNQKNSNNVTPQTLTWTPLLKVTLITDMVVADCLCKMLTFYFIDGTHSEISCMYMEILTLHFGSRGREDSERLGVIHHSEFSKALPTQITRCFL